MSAPSKAPPARTTTLNKPVKAYKTEAQITEYIKTLKVDSAQQTKLMTELAHDPKNLKRFLNRYGEEAESLIKRNGYPPKYWKSRPHHREMQIKEVWENAKKDQKNFYFSKNNTEYIRTEHGTVSWNKDIPRSGQWNMGHLPDQKYSDMYDFFIRGDISEKEFLKWYRTAENYEPQTIPFNRGHKGE